MTNEKDVERILLERYDDNDKFLCGDEVYTLEELLGQTSVIAFEYDLKIEENDFSGTIEEYIETFFIFK